MRREGSWVSCEEEEEGEEACGRGRGQGRESESQIMTLPHSQPAGRGARKPKENPNYAPQPGLARTRKGRDSPGTPKTKTPKKGAAMVSPSASPKTVGTGRTVGAGGVGMGARAGEMGAQAEGGDRSPSQSEEQGADQAPIRGNGLAMEQGQSPPPAQTRDHGLDLGSGGATLMSCWGGWGDGGGWDRE